MIGYRSVVSGATRWRHNQGGLFPLSPPLSFDGLTRRAAQKLRRDQGCLFIRWESDFDQIGEGSWWHVIKDVPDDISSLPKKTRYMIKKAAKTYHAKPISRHDVIELGYDVYKKAYERYETYEPMFGEEEFKDAIICLPEATEFWGVYDNLTKEMVAFSENYVESGVCFYVSMWLDPVSMSKFSGYLLFYEMENHYLVDRSFRYISDGARSLSHDTEIHDFLIRKFKFRKAYASLNVAYVPWLRWLVGGFYPLRALIGEVPLNVCKKASVLLKQEEAFRGSRRG